MSRLFYVLSCFVIFSGYAVSSDNPQCAGRGTSMQGWDFLQNGSKIDMVKRNFNMSVNITCMSSTTIDIENSTHRASQWVSFYNWSRTSWVNGTQNLTAYPGEDEKYNFMNTTYNLGFANNSYQFLYVEPNCSVVQVTYLNRDAISSSMQTKKDETKFPFCALWVRDGDLETTHTCCEAFFTNNCTGPVYSVYKKDECKALPSNKRR